jgi:hypothetical protein
MVPRQPAQQGGVSVNIPTDVLQWAGCATGMLGSLLLATKTRFSGWGFAVYLLSNGFWIGYGLIVGAPAIVVQQLFFTGTSLLGIWRWLAFPLVERFRRARAWHRAEHLSGERLSRSL